MPLLSLEACSHPTVMTDLCAVCGIDLRKLDDNKVGTKASVSMIHTVPDLKVSIEEAQKLGKTEEGRLLAQRKLHLLVDLDQTLIHTTNDNVPNNIRDVHHFQLYGHGSVWYHTKFRPGTSEFLENMSKLYELHICTFGTRQYAHMIARYLDPEGKYFHIRILSRDECFNPNSKTANLKELFPNGDHMVCIIDDREDVWNFVPNLIHVKPYHFFRHTGDINAPPGLAKRDKDDQVGVQFTQTKDNHIILSAKTEGSGVEEEKDLTAQAQESAGTQQQQQKVKREALNAVKGDLSLSDDDEDEEEDQVDAPEVEEKAVEGGSESSNSSSSSSSSSSSDEEESDSTNPTPTPTPSDVVSPTTPTPATPTPTPVSGTSDDHDHDLNPEEATANNNEAASKSGDSDNKKVKSEGEAMDGSRDQENKENRNEEDGMEVDPDSSKEKGGVIEPTGDGVVGVTPPPDLGKIQLPPKGDGLIDIEDDDDYLLYLSDILSRIHTKYFQLYDEVKKVKVNGKGSGETAPDVKNVIPEVRKQILKGCSIVFSGVVPVGDPVHLSRPYAVAVSLGATVTEKIIPHNRGDIPGSSKDRDLTPTTHLVAARLSTVKVNEARKVGGIQVVTPNWLWSCAERWERVDERLFHLTKNSEVKRFPPAHVSSPEDSPKSKKGSDDSVFYSDSQNGQTPGSRRERTNSGRFMDTINPLMSFSLDEIASMDQEVEDMIAGESDSSSTSSSNNSSSTDSKKVIRRKKARAQPTPDPMETLLATYPTSRRTKSSSSSSSSDSSNSSSSDEETRGRRPRARTSSPESISSPRKRRHAPPGYTETEEGTEDEPLNAKFRRGEPLPSDVELMMTNPDDDDDDDDDDDEGHGRGHDGRDKEDGEWMNRALEREFLGGDSSQSGDDFMV